MALLQEIGGMWNRVREYVRSGTDTATIGSVSIVVSKASRLPEGPRKQKAFEDIIRNIEGTISEHPEIAYFLHAQVGNCVLRLSRPQEALEHFGAAINKHPSPTPTSDFPGYVDGYLDAAQRIMHLPLSKESKTLLDSAAVRTESLIPKLPFLEYKLQAFIGMCRLKLDQPQEALSHLEKAVLLHPNPTPESDFPNYTTNYLASVKLTTQRAAEHRSGKRLKTSIARITAVVQSTARVGQTYPQLEGLAHEGLPAVAWIQRYGGVKAVRRAQRDGHIQITRTIAG